MRARPGAALSRPAIERAIAARGVGEGFPYRVDWDASRRARPAGPDRAPPFTAPLLAGGSFDLAAELGRRPALIAFWATWCAACIAEAPALQALHEAYDALDVAFVAVSIDDADDRDKLSALVAELGLGYPIALDPDGSILARYASSPTVPLTLVVDAGGAIVYRHQNFEAGDEIELDRALRSVLFGQP